MSKLLTSCLLLVTLSIFIHAQEHVPRPGATPIPRPTSTPTNPATNAGGWVTFRSDEGQFSVLVPAIPETKVETTPSSHGPYTTTLFIYRDETNIYLLGFVDYDPSFNFNRRAELEANRDNFIKGVKATLLSTRDGVFDGYGGIEFVAESTDRVFTSRVFMVGRRPYQIAFVYPKGVDDTVKKNRFFNSFRIGTITAANTPVGPKPTIASGSSNSAQSYYDQGEALYNQKKYSEALDLYLKAVQSNPSMASAYYRIGWIYNNRENYTAAVDALKKGLSVKPNDSSAYFELGFAYKELDNFDEAVKSFRQAVQIRPNYSAALYQLGWIYNEQNRYNDAIDSLKMAISYRGNFAEARNELGYALHQLRRYPEAIQEYQAAIAQRQDYASAIYNLGMTYVATNNKNGAIEQYRILQRIDNTRATKLFNQIK